jgi:hypothetical protein
MIWVDRITARHLAMNEELRHGQPESEMPERTDIASDGWMDRLKLNIDLPEREFRLYVRYVRALALLCECAPFVDDEDYAELIDELLADAVKHYPLEGRHDGDRREIALRSPATRCETRKLVE